MSREDDGLIGDEAKAMDCLVEAVEYFNKLPIQHPADSEEFATSIHDCQKLLALRVVRREHPEGWYNKLAD